MRTDEFDGTTTESLVKLSDEILAAYGIPRDRAMTAEEVRQRERAYYQFLADQKRYISQEDD